MHRGPADNIAIGHEDDFRGDAKSDKGLQLKLSSMDVILRCLRVLQVKKTKCVNVSCSAAPGQRKASEYA